MTIPCKEKWWCLFLLAWRLRKYCKAGQDDVAYSLRSLAPVITHHSGFQPVPDVDRDLHFLFDPFPSRQKREIDGLSGSRRQSRNVLQSRASRFIIEFLVHETKE